MHRLSGGKKKSTACSQSPTCLYKINLARKRLCPASPKRLFSYQISMSNLKHLRYRIILKTKKKMLYTRENWISSCSKMAQNTYARKMFEMPNCAYLNQSNLQKGRLLSFSEWCGLFWISSALLALEQLRLTPVAAGSVISYLTRVFAYVTGRQCRRRFWPLETRVSPRVIS